MYSELIIRPKALEGTILYPDLARKIVSEAVLSQKVKIPNLIFNRHENGKSIEGRFFHEDPNHISAKLAKPPVVSFDGGKGFIRLYMLGKTGRDLMAETAPLLSSAIAKHVGGPYGFLMNEGMCKLSVRDNPILYTTRRLMMTKSRDNNRKYENVAPQDISDEIRRVILKGLISQAKWLDEDTNGECSYEHLIPDENSLGFYIAEGKSCLIMIDEKNFGSGYKNLSFSMNLEMTGPWAAGMLRSKGCGKISKLILREQHD